MSIPDKIENNGISRREFVQNSGLAAAGVMLTSYGCGSKEISASGKDIPLRTLGKTGESVTSLAMGTTGIGFSDNFTPKQVAEIAESAYDAGVRYFDTARRYRGAEEGLGMVLPKYRNNIFLTTKVFADTIDEAEKSLATSFKLLKTDSVDLLYFHNLGKRDMDKALAKDGVFPWLVKQKKAGKCRFIGISGHNYPDRFPQFIETGEVDVVMCPINFGDRYTYNFEGKVLPAARKFNCGIVAMKVMGGIAPGDTLENLKGGPYPPAVGNKNVELAIRYALGVKGVAVANTGVYNSKEIHNNAEIARNYKPLNSEETAALEKLGRQLAAKWGEHFGPVNEKKA